ncbi:CHC2 zinc finger domain-containing protein [Sphingomonas sp. PP-CE-1G-424]|uniref:CHC2 zinc finger domain-containing protein n=1 Tax=Sphingomonas sp. PP-CE-1G-424 TaxID=2135658 RepID=UPI001054C04F|nr:CHC2 zinc finger domain-containing protein [Sphingomonas sp. PP-CE-1G-424]TCP66547.1 CHC2-type zinc finger protein [Sphingomonas sp. PP-CE-1G-424]
MENNTFSSHHGSTRGALVGLISQTVQLQPFVDGVDRLRGAFSWHPDGTRSLHATDTAWQCFACRAGGDAVDWIMRREAVDKTQARERFQESLLSKQ